MKYFKFAQISAESGISWAIEQPISGPSMPPLPGLTKIIQLEHTNRLYFVGEVDDTAVADPDNHIWELTLEEYSKHIKDHVFHVINQQLENIFNEEKVLRQSILGKYDSTATVAGVYKYEQAKAYLLDNTASVPDISAEASIRGMSVTDLCNRIVTNHEEFRAKERKIAGVRGLVFDRLTNFAFDDAAPYTSYEEFISTEVIGTTTRAEIDHETGRLVDREVDMVIGKYSMLLGTRYEFLG